jgi:hypothetical protein
MRPFPFGSFRNRTPPRMGAHLKWELAGGRICGLACAWQLPILILTLAAQCLMCEVIGACASPPD